MRTRTARLTWIPEGIEFFLGTLAIVLALSCARAQALSLDVRPENSTVLYEGDGSSVFQIRVAAPDLPLRPDRPPLNLSLVLDRSGSMRDEGKIHHVREAAHMLVDRLGPEDTLAIVTYNDKVSVSAPSSRVTDRRRFHRIIDEIAADGRTFLSGGLEEGFRQVRRQKRRGSVSRVILLSDGLANVGVTDTRDLERRTGAMYEDGVSVSTFGMGYEFDEDLLMAMAGGGGGSYHYISHSGDIVAALKREFNMAARTAASGVEIIIRPLGGSRFERVPGHRWRFEDSSAVIRLGDLSAGEERTLMANLSVPTGRIGDREVAHVSLRYTDPLSGEVHARSGSAVSLAVIDDPERHSQGFDPLVQEKKAVIESSALMEEAAKKVDAGDREGARSVIMRAIGALRAAPSAPAVKQEMEMVEEYSENLDDLDTMAPAELREMQKEQKYRSYRQIHQQ